jgi:hypothetical protein
VNAASDIFEDSKHVNYNTLKNRIIDYVNTPDFMKPYSPSIVGRDEYIDFMDYIEATDDLLTVLPFVNNDTVNSVENTPLFKNINTIVMKTIRELTCTYEPVDTNIEYFLQPYILQGHVNNMIYFKDYTTIAKFMIDVAKDNVLLFERGGVNPYFDRGRKIEIDGYTYTTGELIDRVASAKININDGIYEFKDSERLMSQEISQVPGEIIAEGPIGVRVSKVAEVFGTYFSVSKSTRGSLNDINFYLGTQEKPEIVVPPEPFTDNPDAPRYSSEEPNVIMDIDNIATAQVSRRAAHADPLISCYDKVADSPTDHSFIDLSSKTIDIKKAEMGIESETDMNSMYETYAKKDTCSALSVVETGFMFVFAVVCFITAWVYR